MKFGLPESTYHLIVSTFSKYPDIHEVKIYGSRSTGNEKPYSDVDLALFGSLSDQTLGQVLDELEGLSTPYSFDVTDYSSIEHLPLKHHIDTHGQQIYLKK